MVVAALEEEEIELIMVEHQVKGLARIFVLLFQPRSISTDSTIVFSTIL